MTPSAYRFLFLLAIAAILAVGAMQGARGHEWYDFSCCSDRDCRPVDESLIRVTPEGYQYTPSGEVIPWHDRRIRGFPTSTPPEAKGQYHICTTNGEPATPVLCIYPPAQGS